MGHLNLESTMGRIKTATPDSQIAVSRSDIDGNLNSFFAATVISKKLIADGDPALIGVYDGTMNLEAVKKHLSGFVKPFCVEVEA